jgi:hypothetical protein
MALLDLQTLELSDEAQRGGHSGASKGCGGGDLSGLSLLLC